MTSICISKLRARLRGRGSYIGRVDHRRAPRRFMTGAACLEHWSRGFHNPLAMVDYMTKTEKYIDIYEVQVTFDARHRRQHRLHALLGFTLRL